MGYSINTVFTSSVECNRMLTFRNKYFKSWDDLSGEKNDVRGPDIDPSYYPKQYKYVLGFDYIHRGIPSVEYAYMLSFWMAINAGMRENINNNKIPFVNYDGEENIYLNVNNQISTFPVKTTFINVDELGFRPLTKKHIIMTGSDQIYYYNHMIHEELKRLDQLYKEELINQEN